MPNKTRHLGNGEGVGETLFDFAMTRKSGVKFNHKEPDRGKLRFSESRVKLASALPSVRRFDRKVKVPKEPEGRQASFLSCSRKVLGCRFCSYEMTG